MIKFFKKIKESIKKAVPKKTTTVTCGNCQTKIEVSDFSKAIKCPNCKYKFFMKPPAA